jgi:dynein heavy chain
LNSFSQVSGLITREEMDETLSELSVKMKKEYPKRALTNENLQNYYRERLRKNLHIVLCFSPDNRKFRERALKFPALVSGCTIDWFVQIKHSNKNHSFYFLTQVLSLAT